MIARLAINSLVLTVGTLILLRGVTYLVSDNKPSQLADFTVSDPLIERYGIFSVSSITALIVFVLLGLFLAYTRYGREIYAIGGAREEALAAGVPPQRPMILTFALSGGCAALAGALASLKGGSAAPQNYEDLLLSGAAAALVGGISLYGGRGTVMHVALGVAVLVRRRGGARRARQRRFGDTARRGALLITVVAIEFIAARLSRRSRLRREADRREALPPPRRPDPSDQKGLCARDLLSKRQDRHRHWGRDRHRSGYRSAARRPWRSGPRRRHQGAG